MRITENSLYRNGLYDLQYNQEKLTNLQTEMASGKTINKASDNPAGTIDVLRLNQIIAESKMQKSNVDDGITWLNASDSALSQLTDIVHRAHDLTIQVSNGTYGPEEQQATGKEIDQLLQQTITIANTQINGKYIFAGTKTDVTPYVQNSNGTFSYNGSINSIVREIAPGTTEGINVSIDNVMGSATNTSGLLYTLQSLRDNLNSGNQVGINSVLDQLNKNLNDLQSAQADIGAKTNRFQSSSSSLTNAIDNFTNLLSNVQDVDIAETYTQLNVEQNVYQASLQTVAKIQQTSLLNYLR